MNQKLWRSVIGGYGLLGVISDVTLQLVPNDFLKTHYALFEVRLLAKEFLKFTRKDKDNIFLQVRLSTAPDSSFLREMVYLTLSDTHELASSDVKLNKYSHDGL